MLQHCSNIKCRHTRSKRVVLWMHQQSNTLTMTTLASTLQRVGYIIRAYTAPCDKCTVFYNCNYVYLCTLHLHVKRIQQYASLAVHMPFAFQQGVYIYLHNQDSSSIVPHCAGLAVRYMYTSRQRMAQCSVTKWCRAR